MSDIKMVKVELEDGSWWEFTPDDFVWCATFKRQGPGGNPIILGGAEFPTWDEVLYFIRTELMV